MRLVPTRDHWLLFLSILITASDAADVDGSQVLGEFCDDDEDCYEDFNLTCDKEHNSCVCRRGFVAMDFMCKPQAWLGEDCSYNRQCSSTDHNSACISGHCRCKSGYLPVPGLNSNLKCILASSNMAALFSLVRYDKREANQALPFIALGMIVAAAVAIGCIIKCCTVVCSKKQKKPLLIRTPGNLQQKRYYNYETFGKTKQSMLQKPSLGPIPEIVITPDSFSASESRKTFYV